MKAWAGEIASVQAEDTEREDKMKLYLASVLVNNGDGSVTHYPQIVCADNEVEGKSILYEAAESKYPNASYAIVVTEITPTHLNNMNRAIYTNSIR